MAQATLDMPVKENEKVCVVCKASQPLPVDRNQVLRRGRSHRGRYGCGHTGLASLLFSIQIMDNKSATTLAQWIL